MTVIQGFILGLIQGLTEFLPVSSSGHLVLAGKLLNISQPPVIGEAVLHLGTLLAVVFYLRKEVGEIAKSIWLYAKERKRNEQFNLALLIIFGSIPAAVAGVLFADYFETAFSSVLVVGLMLLLTGVLLFLSERASVSVQDKSLSVSDSLIIGIAQAAAIMPGLSRSGTTISSGLFLGLSRPQAAKFSFLLSIPVILGAGGLSFVKALNSSFSLLPLAVGALTAFVSGYFAINLLMRLLSQQKLRFLAIYCFIVGSLAILYFLWL